MTLTHRRGSGVSLAALVIAGLALLASPAVAQVRPTFGRLQSLATGADSGSLILRYVRTIPDTEFVTDPGAGDEQRLMVGTCPASCTYGPRAKIQPRRYGTSWPGARRDSGEVIARIISDGRYHKFNIHGRDTVYWWVGPRGGRLVSIFTSTAPDARPLVSDVVVDSHARGYWTQALARWLWDDRDELAWGTCDDGSCCRSRGTALVGR